MSEETQAKALRIVAVKVPRFRRGGIDFTSEPQDWLLSELTTNQINLILGEKQMLHVAEINAEDVIPRHVAPEEIDLVAMAAQMKSLMEANQALELKVSVQDAKFAELEKKPAKPKPKPKPKSK